MTFDELNLNTALFSSLDELGYSQPTTIQHRVFPVVMSGRDVCGIAQTGTGKTFAYLLPCLRLWKFNKAKLPEVVIIVPTRELVVQVVDAIKSLTGFMNLTAVGVYGGANINTQKNEIEKGADIVVGTPGRFYDLAVSGVLKTKAIKRLVIDEVDEMLNLGFRSQLKNILDLLPEKRQNLLFSATMTEDVELLIDQYFNDPIRVEAAPTGTPLENILQTGYIVPNFNTKINLIKSLLAVDTSMTKVLIFVATKQLADKLFDELEPTFTEQLGIIHSNKEQNHRFNTVKQFQAGTYKAVIATDIVARGIDISEVTHVINFDIPEVPENYIHRIGRTGRYDKKGIAITFITERETSQHEAIETLMKFKIPLFTIPAEVEISDIYTDIDRPPIIVKNIQLKLPNIENKGAAFHEKSAKNSKVNFLTKKKDRMMAKYGRPIKRRPKK
jgi:ATP-dependent RNA helicase RhlE